MKKDKNSCCAAYDYYGMVAGVTQNYQIIRLLLKGLNPKAIVEKLSVDPSRISYYRKKLGITPFPRGGGKGFRKATLPMIKIAVRMKVEGKTYHQIGKRLGVSRQRVQQLLKPENWIPNDGKLHKCGICKKMVSRFHNHHADYSKNHTKILCVSCHAKVSAREQWGVYFRQFQNL